MHRWSQTAPKGGANLAGAAAGASAASRCTSCSPNAGGRAALARSRVNPFLLGWLLRAEGASHGGHRGHVSRRQARRCAGGSFVVRTDQPVEAGGAGSAVAPFDLFLASLATCAGIYVLGFCQARGLSTEGIGLRQHLDVNPATKLPSHIRLELTLPASFPDKYRAAVVRAAEGCKVKKTMAAAPVINVVVAQAEASLAHAS